MARILCIETSTKVCSIGLAEDGRILQLVEDTAHSYSHAEQVNLFIEQVLSDCGFENLDAIAVSEGPGSYTGLRIGISTAKGICFAKNIPIIKVSSLEAMSSQIKSKTNLLHIPMIDARRMEVFCAGFNEKNQEIFSTRAEIIDQNSFNDYEDFDEIKFFGDGAEKCREIIESDKFSFVSAYASASGLAPLAELKYQNENFEDLAYFEPYYLKDFVAGVPKVKGLK